MIFHHHPGPGAFGPYPGIALLVRLIFLALFFLVPLIIALAYIWPDAHRRGQPGWLWALTTIFLSWLGVLAYLVVRAFTQPIPRGASPAAYPPASYPPPPATPPPA